MLCGAVMGVHLGHCWIILIKPIYQELQEETEYFTTRDERLYLDLRLSYEYTNEMEKLERNNSETNLKIK